RDRHHAARRLAARAIPDSRAREAERRVAAATRGEADPEAPPADRVSDARLAEVDPERANADRLPIVETHARLAMLVATARSGQGPLRPMTLAAQRRSAASPRVGAAGARAWGSLADDA